MLYNNGIEGKDMWKEVSRFFVKTKNKTQHMNLTKFYTADKFGLLIDLRSMAYQAMQGNGTRYVNSKDGVQLELKRNGSGSGEVKCHVFITSDLQMNIIGQELESVQYYTTMDPNNIPFNALIVGPTNSGKTRFVVDQIYGPFRGKFDYIVLICPTFADNKTLHRIGENDPRMFVIIREQHEVKNWLNLVSMIFEGTNALIILDDCAASKEVKGRTGHLINLGFSARHIGTSVWLLTHKITSITASFRENVAAIVLFYSPSAETTKAIFDDYAGELSYDENKGLISKLKQRKFSHLVLSLCHAYGIEFF